MYRETPTTRRWKLALVVTVALALAALCHKRIPDGVTESWKARQAVGLLRSIGVAVRTC